MRVGGRRKIREKIGRRLKTRNQMGQELRTPERRRARLAPALWLSRQTLWPSMGGARKNKPT